ncbi:hypothetical protein LP420_09385 [Massilia sp. B-10]|nr:hypothetical protein LP420_09385 [Massilia sp. B-10]
MRWHGHFGELAYPTGGHYLPLPSPESVHVREILFDLGIIERDPFAEKPTYDERFILHGPEERLLFKGEWQDGFLPTHGVDAAELAEHRRFFDEVERLRQLRGCRRPARVRVPDRAFLARPGLRRP